MLMEALRGAYYRLPEPVQRAILVRRMQQRWIKAGIVFVHIPKAAGTSMNLSLYGRFMGHPHALDIERWGSSELKSVPSFAITRNPWDRLVSAYRFARRGHGVGGGFQAGVRHPERYRLAEMDSFDSFVRNWLAKRDIAKLDNFLQPQWAFVCDSHGKVLLDHVGRVEDLEPTLDFIRESIGRVAPIEQANRSGERVDYRDFYTPELAELTGRIYREDIEMFGYQF